MTGAGERVSPLARPEPFGLLIVPSPHALSTPDVYRAFDRLGGARTARGAGRARAGRRAAASTTTCSPPRCELCPPIAEALAAVTATGAAHALVSGSGPTVFGLFPSAEAARAAARTLPGAVAAEPVGPDFGEVRAA